MKVILGLDINWVKLVLVKIVFVVVWDFEIEILFKVGIIDVGRLRVMGIVIEFIVLLL